MDAIQQEFIQAHFKPTNNKGDEQMKNLTQIEKLAQALIEGRTLNGDAARKIADVHEMPRSFRKLVTVAAAHGVFIKSEEKTKKNGGTFKVWYLPKSKAKKLAKVVGL